MVCPNHPLVWDAPKAARPTAVRWRVKDKNYLMLITSYKIASICMLIISGVFMLWTFRLGKEGKLPLIKFLSILIFGIFVTVFPGGSFFFIGIIVIFWSLILIFYQVALVMPRKNKDGL